MKTAFKRVALVAAAALAIGGVSAVSANAAGALVSDSFTAGTAATASTTGTTGVPATVALTWSAIDTGSGNAAALSGTVVSSPITSASSTVGFALTSGATQVNLAGTAAAPASAATGRVTEYVTASFTPDVSGTYTIKLASIGAINNAYVIWTVTVAAPAAITAANSTIFTSNVIGTVPAATNVTVVASKAASTTPVGIVSVTEGNGATVAPTAVALSASVSGPGFVSFANNGTGLGRAITSDSATLITSLFVYGDGTAGVSTITLSAGTTVLGTTTVTFYGTAASISASVNVGVLPKSLTHTGLALDAITVVEKDTNGVALPQGAFGTLTFTSDATTVVASAGTYDASPVPTTCTSTAPCYGLNTLAVAGTANITVADGTLTAAPVAVRVSDASTGTPASVTSITFATDAASYPAGGVGTLTITLADAAGTVPAGTYPGVLSAQATSSLALVTGTLPGGAVGHIGDITVGNAGTATITFNAPLSDGTVTVTGTPTSTSTVVTPASFTVASGSSDAANAATDAANEATDAANAATDAANAAADSADAATQAAMDAGDKADAALAAVTALSQQVTTLLAKVASLAATLAKITKAIAALPKK
jgi:hypothetical protein